MPLRKNELGKNIETTAYNGARTVVITSGAKRMWWGGYIFKFYELAFHW
jgi:hypothetical protein